MSENQKIDLVEVYDNYNTLKKEKENASNTGNDSEVESEE